jgi:hypothetical protein
MAIDSGVSNADVEQLFATLNVEIPEKIAIK